MEFWSKIKLIIFAAIIGASALFATHAGLYQAASILVAAFALFPAGIFIRRFLPNARGRLIECILLLSQAMLFAVVSQEALASVVMAVLATLFIFHRLGWRERNLKNPLLAAGLFLAIFASTPVIGQAQYLYGIESLPLTWLTPLLCFAAGFEVLMTIQRLTEERNQLALRVGAQKRQIREKSQAQTEFLTNFARETRSPLNGVLGMTDILIDSSLDVEQRKCAEMVKCSAETLQRQLSDLMDYHKLQEGLLTLEKSAFNLKEVLEDLVSARSHATHQRGLQLNINYTSCAPKSFLGDVEKIQLIVGNLVDNALKFTNEGSVDIHVHTQEQENGHIQLDLEVADTGCGIPLHLQESIFQNFAPQHGHRASHIGRTGLGLAICQGFAQFMEGDLHFESKEGEGTRFYLSVPVELNLETADLPDCESANFPGARALIIEPEWLDREILSKQLSAWMMDVRTAKDYGEASDALLKASASGGFDVVITNLDLCEEDAMTVARRLRGDPSYEKSGLLIYSNRHPEAAEREALEGQDVNAFLLKPAKRARIHQALRRALRQSNYQNPKLQLVKNAPVDTLSVAPIAPESLDLSDKCILVVDDNPVNRHVAVGLLKVFSAKTLTAAGGAEALDLIFEQEPDLVLMDCQMPDLDGYETTIRARKGWKSTKRLPIVALTANAESDDQGKAKAAGMDDFLSKPVTLDALAKTLRTNLFEMEADTISTGPQILDWQKIEDAAGGEETLAHQILGLFLEDTAQRLYQLEREVASAKADKATATLQFITGSSRHIGAVELEGAAQDMVQVIDSGDWHGAGSQQISLRRALRNLHLETTRRTQVQGQLQEARSCT